MPSNLRTPASLQRYSLTFLWACVCVCVPVCASAGQVFSQSTLLRTDVRQTWEGPAVDDDSYLGYSVASGDLQSDGEGGVAVGMPRGHGLKGKVRAREGQTNKNTRRVN